MSVANSLILPTYPPQPTQAGFTIQVQQYAPQLTNSIVEVCRQRLPKGIWVMTASVVLTGGNNQIKFIIKTHGVIAEFFYVVDTSQPYSYTFTIPITIGNPTDVIFDAEVSLSNMAIENETLVKFTRII